MPASSRIGWKAARCVPFLRGATAGGLARASPSASTTIRCCRSRPSSGVEPRDARLFMVADKRWKYVHAIGFRPMLYDLENDPHEFRDLGADPALRGRAPARSLAALARLGPAPVPAHDALRAQIRDRRGKSQRRGILIGVWDESDVPDELWSGYTGEGA